MKMKCQTLFCIFQTVILLPCLFVFSFSPQLTLAESGSDQLAYYIVFEKHGDGTIVPVYYRSVELAAPLQSVSDRQLTSYLAQPSRNTERMVIMLQAKDKNIVYQNAIEVSPWLRGEFHGATMGEIDGHILPAETPAFVVRVPRIEGTTLVIKDTWEKTITQFDLAYLAAETPLITFDPRVVVESQSGTGPAVNRVDLLILGDGYTAAQSAQFNTDAANIVSQFFLISPYSLYQNYFNIHTLFTASDQSGADHPPYDSSCGYSDPNCCGDPTMLSDPLQGQMVDTAFDSQFCAYWIHRLLVVNSSKVLAAAAAVPDWDEILVIVNDATYGGSGDNIMTISINSEAAQIAQHEFGHSFANLADEYESAYPSYPSCSDIAGPTCESNVTDVTNPLQIKWRPWILLTTPIPTPKTDTFDGLVGLFEGARYRTTGMYRPGLNCLMRSLGSPFCQVPSQSYVLTLYNGGWGIPSSGIRLIEPGSTFPTTDRIILFYPDSQVFQASILQPIGGPLADIQWTVNDISDLVSHTDTFTYTPVISDVGNNVEIQLLVQDTTSLVHPAMVGASLQSSHIWTVAVVTTTKNIYLPIMLKNPNP